MDHFTGVTFEEIERVRNPAALARIPKYTRQIKLGLGDGVFPYRFTPKSIGELFSFFEARDAHVDRVTGMHSTIEALVVIYGDPGSCYGLTWPDVFSAAYVNYNNPSVEAFFRGVAGSRLRHVAIDYINTNALKVPADLPSLVEKCVLVMASPFLTRLSFDNFFQTVDTEHVQNVSLLQVVVSGFLAHMNNTLLQLRFGGCADIKKKLQEALDADPPLTEAMRMDYPYKLNYIDLGAVRHLLETIKAIDARLAANRVAWQDAALIKNRSILADIERRNSRTALLEHYYWTVESIEELFLFLGRKKDKVDELVICYGMSDDEYSLLLDRDVAACFFSHLAQEDNGVRLFKLQVDRERLANYSYTSLANLSSCILENPRLNGIDFGAFFFVPYYWKEEHRIDVMIEVIEVYGCHGMSRNLRTLKLFGAEQQPKDMFSPYFLESEEGREKYKKFARLMTNIQSRVQLNRVEMNRVNTGTLPREIVELVLKFVSGMAN